MKSAKAFLAAPGAMVVCTVALAMFGGCGDAAENTSSAAGAGGSSSGSTGGTAANGGGSAGGGDAGKDGGGPVAKTPCVASFGDQVLGGVAVDSTGHVVVGGDAIVKLDAACEPEWHVDGVLAGETFSKVAIDAADRIVSIGPVAAPGQAPTDSALAAILPGGASQWTELAGAAGASVDLAVDPAGNANLAFSTVDVDQHATLVVRHFFSDGVLLWETRFVQGNLNGTTFDTPRIAADAEGNVFIAAGCGEVGAPCAVGFGATTLPEGNGLFLAKVDWSGEVQWAKFYPNDGAPGCHCGTGIIFASPTTLAVAAAGGIVVSGRGDVDFGGGPAGVLDYLARMDAGGAELWSIEVDNTYEPSERRSYAVAPSGDIWELWTNGHSTSLQRITSAGVLLDEVIALKHVVVDSLAVDKSGVLAMSGTNRAGADLGTGPLPAGSFVARIAP
jgi:hypothetical protein